MMNQVFDSRLPLFDMFNIVDTCFVGQWNWSFSFNRIIQVKSPLGRRGLKC